jgi:hypothetical protein
MNEGNQEFVEIEDYFAKLCRWIPGSGKRKRRQKKVERRVLLGDLTAKMVEKRMSTMPTQTPLLPVGSKAYFRRGNKEILVFEQPPTIRSVAIYNDEKRYQLAFPYVIYVFCLEDGYMPNYRSSIFFRNAPMASMDDKLLVCCMTHAYVEDHRDNIDKRIGAVCMQGNFSTSDPLEKKIVANLGYYWETYFNVESDHNDFFTGLMKMEKVDKSVSSVAAWQRRSEEDPLFALQVPWVDAGITVQQAVDRAFNNELEQEKTPVSRAEQLADIFYQLKEV